VAGTLRLDLASYREMQAFAQFASDLDKSTQRQLARGERLVEILKQPQYQPLPFEQQVLVLYAGTQGYVDTLPVSKVGAYQEGLISYFETEKKATMDELRASKALDESVVRAFKEGIKAFGEKFGIKADA
jgi:F-type H+-transporting ATPase subunit alpha